MPMQSPDRDSPDLGNSRTYHDSEALRFEESQIREYDIFEPIVFTLCADFVTLTHQQVPFILYHTHSHQELCDSIRSGSVHVAVIKMVGQPTWSLEFLDAIASLSSAHELDFIIMGVDQNANVVQQLLDGGRLFFHSARDLTTSQLISLINSCIRHQQRRHLDTKFIRGEQDDPQQLIKHLSTRLAMQADLIDAGRLLAGILREAISNTDIRCLLYNSEEGTLSSVDQRSRGEDVDIAATGLVGFAARTGDHIYLSSISGDPRFDPGIDNPDGHCDIHFAAEPIVGSSQSVVAVIVAIRNGEARPFEQDEQEVMHFVAVSAAPTFDQLALQYRAHVPITTSIGDNRQLSAVFRQEALNSYLRPWNQRGHVLNGMPLWLRNAFWIVIAALIAGLLACALAFSYLKQLLPGLG